MDNKTTPKLCECGCGEEPGVYRQTNTAVGQVRGMPKRFVRGHENRGRTKRTYTPLDQRYRVENRGFTTPCWIWTMSLDNRGYAQMWDTEAMRLRRSHRVYYELIVGPIPLGYHLHHRCRNRNCINPAHLEPLSPMEHGRLSSMAKLSESDREHVFELRAQGWSYRRIGEHLGVHGATAMHCFKSAPPISRAVKMDK